MRNTLTCQALDMNGHRCRSKERLVAVRYHGDSELYASIYDGPEPAWVRVYLCAKHRTPRAPSTRREGRR